MDPLAIVPRADGSLNLALLQAGIVDDYCDGFVHEKTVAHTIIAHVMVGGYTIETPYGKECIAPGEAFLTPANVPLHITHHGDPDQHGRMCAHWVHFHLTLFDTIDFTSLLDMPLRLDGNRSNAFQGIISELLQGQDTWPASPLWQTARRHELAYSLVRHLSAFSPMRPESVQLLKSMPRFAPVLRYIGEHIAEPLSTAQLANVACISVSRFHAAFKEQLGVSPMEYVKHHRLERASHLLISTAMSLQEIAEHVGFKNPFHLSREFKRQFGAAPSAYRKTHRDMMR